jgi:hypothetical protein
MRRKVFEFIERAAVSIKQWIAARLCSPLARKVAFGKEKISSFGRFMWKGDPSEDKKPVAHWFHFGLQLVVGGYVLYWHWKLPSPNKAVLALAACAALMVLAEMRPVHKAIYFVLIVALVSTENHAIDYDRRDFADKEAARRFDENQKFSNIGESITTNVGRLLAQSNQQFEQTAKGLRASIDAATTAMQQTRPYAYVTVTDIRGTQFKNAPLDLSYFHAGSPFPYNVGFKNSGNDPARKIGIFSRLYIDGSDVAAAKTLVNKFDSDWNSSRKLPPEDLPASSGESYLTFLSEVFSQEELDEVMVSHTKTMYIMTRFSYSDTKGSWLSDFCLVLQQPLADPHFPVLHICTINNDTHYKTKRQP